MTQYQNPELLPAFVSGKTVQINPSSSYSLNSEWAVPVPFDLSGFPDPLVPSADLSVLQAFRLSASPPVISEYSSRSLALTLLTRTNVIPAEAQLRDVFIGVFGNGENLPSHAENVVISTATQNPSTKHRVYSLNPSHTGTIRDTADPTLPELMIPFSVPLTPLSDEFANVFRSFSAGSSIEDPVATSIQTGVNWSAGLINVSHFADRMGWVGSFRCFSSTVAFAIPFAIFPLDHRFNHFLPISSELRNGASLAELLSIQHSGLNGTAASGNAEDTIFLSASDREVHIWKIMVGLTSTIRELLGVLSFASTPTLFPQSVSGVVSASASFSERIAVTATVASGAGGLITANEAHFVSFRTGATFSSTVLTIFPVPGGNFIAGAEMAEMGNIAVLTITENKPPIHKPVSQSQLNPDYMYSVSKILIFRKKITGSRSEFLHVQSIDIGDRLHHPQLLLNSTGVNYLQPNAKLGMYRSEFPVLRADEAPPNIPLILPEQHLFFPALAVRGSVNFPENLYTLASWSPSSLSKSGLRLTHFTATGMLDASSDFIRGNTISQNFYEGRTISRWRVWELKHLAQPPEKPRVFFVKENSVESWEETLLRVYQQRHFLPLERIYFQKYGEYLNSKHVAEYKVPDEFSSPDHSSLSYDHSSERKSQSSEKVILGSVPLRLTLHSSGLLVEQPEIYVLSQPPRLAFRVDASNPNLSPGLVHQNRAIRFWDLRITSRKPGTPDQRDIDIAQTGPIISYLEQAGTRFLAKFPYYLPVPEGTYFSV